MAQEFTITGYEGQKAWEGKYGSMLTHYVQLAGIEGTVEVNQKPETASPMPGSTIYGSLTTETKTRRSDGEQFTVTKLKKEQRPDGGEQAVQSGVPVPQTAPPVPQLPQPDPTPIPVSSPAQNGAQLAGDAKDRSIVRQVCLKVAAELHAAELGAGEMAMPERVIELTDKIESGFYHGDLPPF